MRRWQIQPLALALVTMILMTACAPAAETGVEADLNALTGSDCAGRLAGTAGNQAAADYIARQFQALGLQPLDGLEDYFQPYEQETFDPYQQTQCLTAHFADGSTREYRSGADFYPLAVQGELDLEGELRPAAEEENVLEILGPDGAVVGQIVCALGATATLYPAEAMGTSIRVPEGLFEELSGGTYIQVQGALETRESTLSNVIGVYPGKSRDAAILVTAHFDHVGGYGDVVYPGAMDNASGVAVLLQTARLLTEGKIETPCDMVFCAFNGEDMGLKGSAAFCEEELPYRAVNGLNLDTLGAKGAEELEVSDTDTAMAEQMVEALARAGLSGSVVQVGNSDHAALLRSQIPAISLGEAVEHYEGIIHTPADTVDNLDPERLEQIAEGVVSYLTEARLVSWEERSEEEEEQARRELWNAAGEEGALLYAREQPGPGEMVVFQVGQERFGYWQDGPEDDLEVVRARYERLDIPAEKNGFTFVEGGWPYTVENVSLIQEDAGYTDDLVQKRTGMQGDSEFYLRYADQQGIVLEARISLTEPWAFSLEGYLEGYEVETTADQRLRLLRHEGGAPAGAFWYEEGDPYAYRLSCATEEGYETYSLEALGQLLQSEMTAAG